MAWSVVGLDDMPSGGALTDDVSWLRACAEVEEGRHFALRHGDVFLPLRIRNGRGGLTVLESLGQDFRSVAGPTGSRGAGLPRLDPEHLPQPVDLVDFRRLPRECLASLFPENGARVERFDILHFQRDLPRDFEDFLKSMSCKIKTEYNHSKKKVIKKFGINNVRYEMEPLLEKNWSQAWNRALSLTPHTWQGRAGVSLLLNEKKKKFLASLVKTGFPVFIHFYHLGESLVAFSITIEKNDQALMYTHEYNIDFGKYRPGYLINICSIENSMSNKVNRLDFGVGDAPHKHTFRCTSKDLWRLLVPLTLKGRMAVSYQQLRWLAGALIKRNTEVKHA